MNVLINMVLNTSRRKIHCLNFTGKFFVSYFYHNYYINKFVKFRKNLTNEEVNELLEEGKFYLACQLMNNNQDEEAIEAFKNLHSPYASFYEAMVSNDTCFLIYDC